MAIFKVVYEIVIEAENSLEAAKTVEDWLQNPNDHWQYYVQNVETGKIESVDLEEDESCAVVNADNYISMSEN